MWKCSWLYLCCLDTSLGRPLQSAYSCTAARARGVPDGIAEIDVFGIGSALHPECGSIRRFRMMFCDLRHQIGTIVPVRCSIRWSQLERLRLSGWFLGSQL